MTAVLLALTASAAWGTADFLGGLKARTVPLAAVLFVSQLAGLVAILVLLVALGRPMPQDGRLWLSFAAGALAVMELGVLYLAMARGPAIVLAPIAALGASIPVTVGLIGGDPLTLTVAVGLGCALLGSVASSLDGSAPGEGARIRDGLPLALCAAAGIGLFLILFDRASEADPYWATGGMRAAGFATAVAFVALAGGRASGTASMRPDRPTLAVLATIGLCDVLADGSFATATTHGELSIVTALASLYPAVAVIWAYAWLREKVRRVQIAGVALALTGIALLAGTAG